MRKIVCGYCKEWTPINKILSVHLPAGLDGPEDMGGEGYACEKCFKKYKEEDEN